MFTYKKYDMNCRITEKENQMARKKIPRVKIKLEM